MREFWLGLAPNDVFVRIISCTHLYYEATGKFHKIIPDPFYTTQFVDDAHRGRLRSILAELRPVELIKPVTGLDSATERALKDHTRQPLINTLEPGKEVRVLFR